MSLTIGKKLLPSSKHQPLFHQHLKKATYNVFYFLSLFLSFFFFTDYSCSVPISLRTCKFHPITPTRLSLIKVSLFCDISLSCRKSDGEPYQFKEIQPRVMMIIAINTIVVSEYNLKFCQNFPKIVYVKILKF